MAVYLLSFTFLAIYWNNHHHMFQVVDQVNGAVLWANPHLLFWLSLTPAASVVARVAFERHRTGRHVRRRAARRHDRVLHPRTRTLLAVHPSDSRLAQALGRDWKGELSVVAYVVGIVVAFVEPTLAPIAIYVAVAVVWLVPESARGASDRRRRRGRPSRRLIVEPVERPPTTGRPR